MCICDQGNAIDTNENTHDSRYLFNITTDVIKKQTRTGPNAR